jgi:uncharacterized membrane protein YphA (DoxX/SURF4 family)
LAVFTLVAAYLFHMNFGDRNQVIHFMKNLAIAGGFLALAAGGPGVVCRWKTGSLINKPIHSRQERETGRI